MDEFAGRVALITGAGRGAGRDLSVAFSSIGASIAANDINPLSLDETIAAVLLAGGTARPFVFDVAKRMPIEAMVAGVLEHFGRIDFLVNHASVKPDARLLDMDEWEFHRTLDVNLGGPFFTLQQVGRVMRQQGGGVMLNLVSAVGAEHFQKGHVSLSASQAGVVGLTRPAAEELSAYHIRINTLVFSPGPLDFLPSHALDSDSYRNWIDAHPAVAKVGDHDLVGKALFLCSDAATAITGQVFRVDPET
jgi:3-oxoacyl-[acyl-carrier protein] reductase